MEKSSLQIGDGEMTVKEVQNVIDNLIKQNPNMTIAEYLKSQNKTRIMLV